MRITSLSLKSNKNSLTIKTKYNNFTVEKSVEIVGRQATDFSTNSFTVKLLPELLSAGDYYFIDNPKKFNSENLFKISDFITSDKDICFFENEKDAEIFYKINISSKKVSKDEYKYLYSKYNLKNKSDIFKYLRMTKVIEVPSNLKINAGFLCLVSAYITKDFEIDKAGRQFVKLTNLTQDKINLLLSYYQELTYNNDYRTNVFQVENNLYIYSLLFINLFANGFNNLSFLTTLGKNKSKMLLNFIDKDYSFIIFDKLVQSLNFQEFMFNLGYIVSIEEDPYLFNFIISNNLKDYFIKTEDGFLLEITEIIKTAIT